MNCVVCYATLNEVLHVNLVESVVETPYCISCFVREHLAVLGVSISDIDYHIAFDEWPQRPERAQRTEAEIVEGNRQASERGVLRRVGEHWRQWGMNSSVARKALEGKYALEADGIRKAGQALEETTGMAPNWHYGEAVKIWISGLSRCMKASGGRVTHVVSAAQKLLANENITVADPHSLVKTVQGEVHLSRQREMQGMGQPPTIRSNDHDSQRGNEC